MLGKRKLIITMISLILIFILGVFELYLLKAPANASYYNISLITLGFLGANVINKLKR